MRVTSAGLRLWAKGLYPLEAAVELLVRAFDGRFARPGNPWIQPCDQPGWWCLDLTPQLTDEHIGHLSGGEQRLLRILASLAGGAPVSLADNIPGLDRELTDLVLAAIAYPNGSHEHPIVHIDHGRGVAVLDAICPPLTRGRNRSTTPHERRTPMPAEPARLRAHQPPLLDMPLIREQLLVEIEQRRHEGASPGELLELRRQYDDLMGRA